MGWREEIWRDRERARFDRWFLMTPMGIAFIDRAGRARAVQPDEIEPWRAQAWQHIDEMIAEAPNKIWISLAAILPVIFGVPMLLGALGIGGIGAKIGTTLAVLIVEAGLIGLDIFDYFHGWQRLRSEIESKVAARAPLAIDPDLSRIPRNWFLLGQYGIAGAIMLLYFATHLNEALIEWIDWRWVFALVPIAWALHFAERAHDRGAQGRLRR